MTAQDYAESRPDLAVNWERANDPEWLEANPGNDGIADMIRQFGSFENYLSADAGKVFDPPAQVTAPASDDNSSDAPPDDTAAGDGSDSVSSPTESVPASSTTAAQYASVRPDLAVNWERAHDDAWLAKNPASADLAAYIRSFGSFEKYLEADAGVTFAPEPAKTTVPAGGTATVSTPSTAPTQQPAKPNGVDNTGTPAQTAGMTATQFANARPDLALNWSRAHDQAWLAQNPGSADVAAYILGFATFEDYLQHEAGVPFDAGGSPTVTNAPAAGSPIKGDPSHVYVGRDARGDVWQLFDLSTGTVKEWAVQPGADSRAMIPGSLRDIGPASSATVAKPPAGYVANPAGNAGGTITNSGYTPPITTTITPGNTTPNTPTNMTTLAKPTIQVGTARSGFAIMQLVDAGGTVKQWITDGAQIYDLVNAPTYGTVYHTATTDAVNLPGASVAPTQPAAASSGNLALLAAAAIAAYFAFSN